MCGSKKAKLLPTVLTLSSGLTDWEKQKLIAGGSDRRTKLTGRPCVSGANMWLLFYITDSLFLIHITLPSL